MNLAAPADIPNWVIGCVAIWLLGCIWMGWRRGVIRQAVAIAALAAGFFTAFSAAPILSSIVPPLGFPVFVRPIVAGVVSGILMWIIVMISGAILFKRTEEQSFGIIRFIYGTLGAGLGLVFGLTVLALAAWTIRLSGTFREGVARSRIPSKHRAAASAPASTSRSTSDTILEIKHLLERTAITSLLSKFDPFPQTLYPQIEKAGQLLSSPEALERLFLAPEMQSISRHPKVMAVREDSAIQEKLRAGDLVSVMRNPKVRAAASDTQILTALNAISLEKQVDLALNPKEAHKEKTTPPASSRQP